MNDDFIQLKGSVVEMVLEILNNQGTVANLILLLQKIQILEPTAIVYFHRYYDEADVRLERPKTEEELSFERQIEKDKERGLQLEKLAELKLQMEILEKDIHG